MSISEAAVVVGPLPPPHGGGTVSVLAFVETLRAAGRQVIVVDTNRSWAGRFPGGIGRIARFVATWRALLAHRNRDVLLCITSGAFIVLFAVLGWTQRWDRVRVFVFGGLLPARLHKIGPRIRKRLIKQANKSGGILMESERSIDALKDLGISQARALGVVRPETSPSLTAPSELSAVFIGRVVAEKGVFEIVRVARRARDWQFYILGPASRAVIDALAEESRGLTNIHFGGRLSHADVADEFSRHMVALLPSRWEAEGIPGTVIEAALVGTPTICADIGQTSAFLEHGSNGYLIDPNNIQEDTLTILAQIARMPAPELVDLRTRTYEAARAFVATAGDRLLKAMKPETQSIENPGLR